MFEVQITNVTTTTFNIPPRAILCELQPVSVNIAYQISKSDDLEESVTDTLTIETDGLTNDEIHSIKQLLERH